MRKVAIVGAGMGGLAVAGTLRRAGFTNIRIFEQASRFARIGAGIQMMPNSMKVLRGIGVEDRLRRLAFAPRAVPAPVPSPVHGHPSPLSAAARTTDGCVFTWGADLEGSTRFGLSRTDLPRTRDRPRPSSVRPSRQRPSSTAPPPTR